MDKAKMMNAAREREPKSGHKMPAASKGGSEVGEETKAKVREAQTGMPSDGLKGAMSELARQHPDRHDDMHAYKGKDTHTRHEALTGISYAKPAKG